MGLAACSAPQCPSLAAPEGWVPGPPQGTKQHHRVSGQPAAVLPPADTAGTGERPKCPNRPHTGLRWAPWGRSKARAGRGPGGAGWSCCGAPRAQPLPSDPVPQEVRPGSEHSTEEWGGQDAAGAGAQSIAKGRSQREGHGGGAAHSHALKKLLVLLVSPATLHLAVQLAQDLILELQRYRGEGVPGTEDVLSSAPGCHGRSSAGHKAVAPGEGGCRAGASLGHAGSPGLSCWGRLSQGCPAQSPCPAPTGSQLLPRSCSFLIATSQQPGLLLQPGASQCCGEDGVPGISGLCPVPPKAAACPAGGQGCACRGPPPASRSLALGFVLQLLPVDSEACTCTARDMRAWLWGSQPFFHRTSHREIGFQLRKDPITNRKNLLHRENSQQLRKSVPIQEVYTDLSPPAVLLFPASAGTR